MRHSFDSFADFSIIYKKTKTDDFYNIIHKILCSCNQCELYIIVHNFKLSPWVVNS